MTHLGLRTSLPMLVLTALLGAGGLWVGILYVSRPILPSVVATEPVVEMVSALGRLEPMGEVIQVFAPTGLDRPRVEELYIHHGQVLRRGEKIARLDTYARRQTALTEAQQQVKVAQARLAQVSAGAKTGQLQAQGRVIRRLQVEKTTEVTAQEATLARLGAELAYAELEDRRYQKLWRDGAVSASLRDTQHLAVDLLRQRIRAAQADVQRIRWAKEQQIAEAQATQAQLAEVRPVDINFAQAQVAQAQAGVARAQADLELTVVRAPQAGQVLNIHTRPGELVGEQGIISLGQTQSMVAVAEIYELDVSRIRLGQKAQITSKNRAFADILYGQVMEVGLEINKQDVLDTDPAAQFDSRVVEVKVRLDPNSSRKVAGLTNLSIQAVIDVRTTEPS